MAKRIKDLRRGLAGWAPLPKSPGKFLEMATKLQELPLEERVYSVFQLFEKNIERRHPCLSAKIFEAAYGDPGGTEYWRYWFVMPSLCMTAFHFVSLLATHVAAEYADAHALDEGPLAVNKRLKTSQREIIWLLQEAGKKVDLRFFEDRDRKALLSVRFPDGGNSWLRLDRVPIVDRSAILEWFAGVPERALVLPESLRAWWDGCRPVEARLYPNQAITQNTMIVDTIINSPIQQGGAQANMTQTVSYSREDLDDLRRLVEMFDAHLDDLNLDAAAKQKAMVQVATIKAQLQDDPDPVIVKQAGRTLRNVTEGAIGSLLANAVQPAVWALASLFIAKLFGGP